jgi:hypothetical protein
VGPTTTGATCKYEMISLLGIVIQIANGDCHAKAVRPFTRVASKACNRYGITPSSFARGARSLHFHRNDRLIGTDLAWCVLDRFGRSSLGRADFPISFEKDTCALPQLRQPWQQRHLGEGYAMTSDRKGAANELNGKKGRGPRSLRGKLQSSRNASRHGLAAAGEAEPAASPAVKRMAKGLHHQPLHLHASGFVRTIEGTGRTRRGNAIAADERVCENEDLAADGALAYHVAGVASP